MKVEADFSSALETGVYPDIEARILTSQVREDGDAYRRAGGYRELVDPLALLREVEHSRLRGRGGAAFPVARKIATVRDRPGVSVVLANGEEGEPISVKDRWLMRYRPHLVIDGVRLSSAMVDADMAIVYVSDAGSADSISEAVVEASEAGWLDIEVAVHLVEPAYVAGEESAAVRAINGGPALPTEKPPRPFESGVFQRPTLVNNVETLANLPFIQGNGASAYADLGTADSAGTFLMTLTYTGRTGLYEVPFGVTLRSVLDWLGVDASTVTGALVGGYFAGMLGSRVVDVPLESGAFAEAGSGLGCGAIALFDHLTCPVSVAAGVLDYFGRNNAGQCGSCFNGTAAMAAVATALSVSRARTTDVERLQRWSVDLRGRGACGTLDGATNVAATLLREFSHEVEAHLDQECARCSQMPLTERPPYAVDIERAGEGL